MSIDVYQPCPCGSGNKLKFCCHEIVDEMAKVRKLQESQQFRVALQTLDGLDKKHPGNPWVATSRASLLLGDDRAAEAKEILEPLLSEYPKHLLALSMHATSFFASEGFEAAKSNIHRVFQRCSAVFPDMVGGLAMGIAAWMFGSGRYMGARAHLTLAMRLLPEKDRQEIFVRLLEFDGNRDIPYPMRSVHVLAHYPGDGESEQQAQQARRVADIGCWAPAARLFAELAEKDPDNAAVWQNVGLCRAWDGDEVGAAEALHRSSCLQPDFALAVELETLAQLLELNVTEDRVRVQTIEYPVKSVAKLLTQLDEADQLAKMEVPPASEEMPHPPAGSFQALDRSCDSESDGNSHTLETIPHVIGQLNIFDALPESDLPSRAFVTGFSGDELDAAQKVFEDAAGDEIDLAAAKTDDAAVMESLPSEQLPLHWRWYFPKSVSVAVRARLEREQWSEVISSRWPSSPLSALAGKTPREAADDSDLKTPLAAALYVFDTFCESNHHALDLTQLAEALQVDLPPSVELNDVTKLNTFSAMRLNRLPIDDLSDDQLSYTLNRALLIHHSSYLYRVLTAVLSRPSCTEKVDLNRVYATLADLARDRYQFDESIEWTQKGKENSKTLKDNFEETLRWEMRELTLRLQDPDDPELSPFLLRLWNYYGPKLPQFEVYLTGILDTFGVKPPWLSGDTVVTAGVDTGATTSDGIWTPGGSEQSAGDEKKLWVPGQD